MTVSQVDRLVLFVVFSNISSCIFFSSRVAIGGIGLIIQGFISITGLCVFLLSILEVQIGRAGPANLPGAMWGSFFLLYPSLIRL